MTSFHEEVLKRYMIGLSYKSHSTGLIYKLKDIRTNNCDLKCHGKFGTCDGTQLIFIDNTKGCVFDLDENTRFELVTENIQKTNMRW